MQQDSKMSHKGSILLYVLFLSSFLILFFISFQGELENMLEGTEDSKQHMQDASSIQDALVSLKNAPVELMNIKSNQNLVFLSQNQNGTIFSESLGQNDSREYWITSTGGSTSITFNIIQGGPVLYHLAVFNSGAEASSLYVSSGVVITSSTVNLSSSLDTHLLVVESLGGFTQYTLDTNLTTTIPSSNSYRLERDINGYKNNEGIYDIINFIPRLRTGFDYEKMGMYLKE